MKESALPAIYPVTCHTDYVGPGSTFVAIKGFAKNGASFIRLAIDKGANRIVIDEREKLSQELLGVVHQQRVQIV